MKLNCHITHAVDFACHPDDCRYLIDHLTRPNSDFQQKLVGWIAGERPLRRDGHIAVVRDHGEIVGWARTESWWEMPGETCWATLEAFVSYHYRGRGIAAFAASGLVASPLSEEPAVAVFAPAMLLLARRVGLHPALFEIGDDGKWVRS